MSLDQAEEGAFQDRRVSERLRRVDWHAATRALDERGWTVLPRLLDVRECMEVADLYDRADVFRSRVIMSRHGYGRGEYRYFSYPLPPLVVALRTALYPRLAPVANGWHERLNAETRFPPAYPQFIERCHAAGQGKPTPLVLRYGPGDFNCLHQDLYGAHVFPLQMAILLSKPGEDFAGGEFVLTEQRPRMQSRVEVIPLEQSDAVVFAVNLRPVRGVRGDYRVKMRHGVSTITRGHRHTLGIILHDAQ
jgi:hypothetical protein